MEHLQESMPRREKVLLFPAGFPGGGLTPAVHFIHNIIFTLLLCFFPNSKETMKEMNLCEMF